MPRFGASRDPVGQPNGAEGQASVAPVRRLTYGDLPAVLSIEAQTLS